MAFHHYGHACVDFQKIQPKNHFYPAKKLFARNEGDPFGALIHDKQYFGREQYGT